MTAIKGAQSQEANIEVTPARAEQEPVVANLLELYAHDFSEFHAVELGPDGRFGYTDLPLYWMEPDRHPFLVRIEDRLAGFVLVKSAGAGSETVWDIAEFFVVRGYRGRGMGTKIAHEVWRRFPGRWQVRVMESNQSAHSFWRHAIAGFTGEATPSVRIEIGNQCWQLFSFQSMPAT